MLSRLAASHVLAVPDVPAAPTLPRWSNPVRAFVGTSRSQLVLAAIGVVVLGFWASWWLRSYEKNVLRPSPITWFERYDYLNIDFLHNYYAARYWIAGGNPYLEPFGDPIDRKLCYPPIVLPFFTWCQFCSARTAVGIWIAALAGFAAIGTVAAWRTRSALGLAPIPLPFALAAILTSAPVAYAMERGNYDLMVVPLIVIAAWALRSRSLGRESLAGSCLALAACFKVYPALLICGLVPMRRFRTVAFAGLATLAFAGFKANDLPAAVANLKELARLHKPERAKIIILTNHSLSGNWRMLWEGTRLHRLAKIPAYVATAVLLGSVLLWVSYWMYYCPDPRWVMLPYFLWIAGTASYVPTVANDYSLFFIPMAALAVWDRRDSVPIQIALAFLFLWAQPLRFTIGTDVLFGLKLLAVFGIATALVNRIREQSPTPAPLPVG